MWLEAARRREPMGGDGGGWGVSVPFQRRRLVRCWHASRPEPAPANTTRVRSARATVALRFRHLGGGGMRMRSLVMLVGAGVAVTVASGGTAWAETPCLTNTDSADDGALSQ